jgi:hypothetical protein
LILLLTTKLPVRTIGAELAQYHIAVLFDEVFWQSVQWSGWTCVIAASRIIRVAGTGRRARAFVQHHEMTMRCAVKLPIGALTAAIWPPSGRYIPIDGSTADADAARAHMLRDCNACAAVIARL